MDKPPREIYEALLGVIDIAQFAQARQSNDIRFEELNLACASVWNALREIYELPALKATRPQPAGR